MRLNDKEKKANRLSLAFKDMQDALRFVSAHDDLSVKQVSNGTSEYFDHCEAIIIAAIISYCRPFKASFSNNNADKNIDINSFTFIKSRADLLSLHNLIIDRRDKVIAHGDWDFRNTELLSKQEGTAVFRKFPLPETTTGFDLSLFVELITSVKSECLYLAYQLDTEILSFKGYHPPKLPPNDPPII